jgi:hypothetical protein
MMKVEVGDRVRKKAGGRARFRGIVVSVYPSLDGVEHCVVESTVPECEGLQHIYLPHQLEVMNGILS